jgi:hypothetical protein
MDQPLVLTIGQAQRADIAGELGAVLGARPLEVSGALNGLDDDTIHTLVPRDDADALHSRLLGGRDIVRRFRTLP